MGKKREDARTYVVGRSNSNAVLKRMPAHMQDFFVEVDLICVCLLSHPSTLTTCTRCRAACTRIALLSTCRACRIDRGWHTNLLSFEGRFVCLQDYFRFFIGIRWIDHEVIVIAAGHDISTVSTEDDFELVENAVVLICIAEARP